MTKTTIMLLVHDDHGQDARLQAASRLTRLLDGHLSCAELAIPAVACEPLGGMVPVLTTDELINETANRCAVEERLLEMELDYSWIEMIGDPAVALARAAALTDIIVIDQDVDGLAFAATSGITNALLRKTSTAVLTTPQDNGDIDFKGRAMIAWDGSPDVIAAMRAAAPILRHASETLLVSVDDGSVTIPAEEAVAYLARDGVAATVQPAYPTLGTAGNTLLHQASSLRPDYIVMGGYGHNYLREKLFGGATRTMLQHSHRALFLAHG